MSKINRTSEHELALAAMKFLQGQPDQSAKTSEVKRNIPSYVTLTADDRAQSDTRDNEELWQQIVGNIVSHRHDSPDNAINRGWISYSDGVWTLTPLGAQQI